MSETKDSPFRVIGKESISGLYGENVVETDKSGEVNERIQTLINSSPIFLFMKGTSETPMCGFSSNVVNILNRFKIKYKTFDVLSDPSIRSGLKNFSNWPTFPQLYCRGQFIGGNDIVVAMLESGELEDHLRP